MWFAMAATSVFMNQIIKTQFQIIYAFKYIKKVFLKFVNVMLLQGTQKWLADETMVIATPKTSQTASLADL